MKNYSLIGCWFIIFIILFTAAGCAKTSKRDTQSPAITKHDVNTPDSNEFGEFEEEYAAKEIHVSDPIEPVNRTMFRVNDFLYFWVVNPVTKTYSNIAPKPVRIGTANFFQNLLTPVRLVNSLLQGKGKAAHREVDRFAINTTIGILGIGDPALDKWNIKPSEEDLGQTLAKYGLGNGPYLVLPFFGPSTLRDTGGMAGDIFLNPIWYVKPLELSIGISTFRYTNEGTFHIGEYESFKAAAVDPYAAMREAYIQHRDKKIKE